MVTLFFCPAPAAQDRTSTDEGFAVTEWGDKGLRFAAVSDIAPEELAQFEQVFRARAYGTAQPK
jgi:anti-sigma factor RsiW